MMKAMTLSPAYKASVLEVPKPTVSDDGVLVKVKCSALGTTLEYVLSGSWVGYFVHARSKPLLLGWHYSGTVEEVGRNVTDLKVGDSVFGHLQYDPSTKQGAFAEYVAVPAGDCARKPPGISHDVAAASTTEALTALQALRDLGGVDGSGGQTKKVLIVGAGGGVGSAAVMIAKNLGAHVTAVCGRKDVDRVKAFGADVVLDRAKTDFLSCEGGVDSAKYDVIFDTPNACPVGKTLQKLGDGGVWVVTLLTWAFSGGLLRTLFSSKSVQFISVKSKKDDLELVGSWLADGTLTVDIDSAYPVKDLSSACRRQRDRTKVGRVVVEVEGGWK